MWLPIATKEGKSICSIFILVLQKHYSPGHLQGKKLFLASKSRGPLTEGDTRYSHHLIKDSFLFMCMCLCGCVHMNAEAFGVLQLRLQLIASLLV